MPSGKTHDLITVLLLPPTFGATWFLTNDTQLAIAATAATAFSGFMFGPDLDTQSTQYTRWGVFRFLWFPYKVVFAHRSQWSHGIVFGTLIRVLYFSGIIALLTLLALYGRAALITQSSPSLVEIWNEWRAVQLALLNSADTNMLWAGFFGLWWGAASHTLTDVGWSILRKGSEIF